MNADDWSRYDKQRIDHQRWGSGNLPHGTLQLPPKRLVADSTIEIPFRHCLVGADEHVLKLHGIEAALEAGLGAGDYLIRSGMDWSAQRDAAAGRPVDYNGNFNTRYRDLFLDCKGKCGGIAFGAAQCSLLSNVVVRHAHPDAYAVRVLRGSTRFRIAELDVENGEPNKDERIGGGLYIDQARGGLVLNSNFHACRTALSIYNSSSIEVINPTLEKVDNIKISGLGNKIRGLNWQWPSDTPLDLQGDQGGTEIEAVFSKLPTTLLHYIDNRGTRRPLIRVSSVFMQTSRQFAVTIRTEWNTSAMRLDVIVEPKSWIGRA